MKPEVFWYRQREPHAARRLEGAVETEVVIVGGGVAGLMCAQALLRRGVATVVVERDFCGAGASGKSSGFVTPASEVELGALVSVHGPAEAKRIWEFVLSGVEALRENVLEHRFDCDHQVQDSLFVASDPAGWRTVQGEHRARQELGYASQLHFAEELRSLLGTTRYRGGVRHGGTFALDPYSYCQALRDLLVSAGATIHENSPVIHVAGDRVTTSHGSVRARHVVVCADRFIPDLGALRDEIYHVQTFLGISRPLAKAELSRVFCGGRMLTWDSDLIYSYFRVVGRDRLLLGGGGLLSTYAHDPSLQMARHARRLIRSFGAAFPDLRLELEAVWSGLLGVSKDLLPVMGCDPRHAGVWYVGAATGLPWAAALGLYAADRILDARDDFDRTFAPTRRFVLGRRAQALLSTPLTYALSHVLAKYTPAALRGRRGHR